MIQNASNIKWQKEAFMKIAVAVLSGYANIVLLFLYIIQAFLVCRSRGKTENVGLVRFMATEMYVIHFLCFLTMYIRTGESRILFFYLLQLCLFLTMGFLYQRFYPNMSKVLFWNMMLLLSIGFIMLTRLDFSLAVRQFVMATITMILSLVIPAFIRSMHRLERYSICYACLGIMLLLVVFLGANERLGAKVWLNIAGMTIQPSEFVKISFIFGMAGLLLKCKSFFATACVTVLAATHVVLLALSKDLGSALLFFIVYLVLLYVAVKNRGYCIAGTVAGVLASIGAYFVFDHVKVRVLAWKDPFAVIDNEGYQVAQSLFAIGNGGFFGTGLCEGTPYQIPVVTTDFMFAAICEELGALFALGILLVYVNSLVVLLRFMKKLTEDYYRLVFLGFITLFATQIFLNVGGIIKMIPSTGVTLPFISYGGSSLCSMVLMFQLLQGMQEKKPKPKHWFKGEYKPGILWKGGRKCLLRASFATLLLLACMSVYFTVFMCTSARTVIYHSYNRRQESLEKKNVRGRIYAADGTVLAESLLLGEEEKQEIRVYPYGKAFAHIVGQQVIGASGLESAHEIALLTASMEEREKFVYRVKGEKAPGNEVHTTLNPKLQIAAYEALEGKKGAVCVLEPKTGKLLAAVSSPQFDPNTLSAAWEQLNEQEDAPLFNRAIYGLYAPGSTFKLVTALAHLRTTGSESFSYDCNGVETLQGISVSCYKQQAHGHVDLKTAFVTSCNTAFSVMGLQIEKESFTNVVNTLYWTKPLPSELAYTTGNFSLNGDAVEQVQAYFGQGTTQVTPYYMAMFTAAIANGGILQQPYVTEYLTNAKGEVLLEYNNSESVPLLTEAEAALLTDYMVAASERTKLSDFCEEYKLTVAGKTGTAEYNENGTLHNHAWFVCFAPAENPQIAMSVLVEDAGLGNESAVPIAKKILKEWLQTTPE